jgi:hypothetical protein
MNFDKKNGQRMVLIWPLSHLNYGSAWHINKAPANVKQKPPAPVMPKGLPPGVTLQYLYRRFDEKD